MSRTAEILAARDQLNAALSAMGQSYKPANPTLQAAIAAGVSVFVNIALDLNRLADALDAKFPVIAPPEKE